MRSVIVVKPMDEDWYDGWLVEHNRETWRPRGGGLGKGLDTFWVAPRTEDEAHTIAAFLRTASPDVSERTLYERAIEMAGGARK